MNEPDKKKIQWHSGFIAAIELELAENRNDLYFEREYNLNTKPLSVDLLVIKKESDAVIHNEIGEIFRKHNLWEYKSGADKLNIDVFYKVIGYACLYKAYGNTVDERHSDDITISLIRNARPNRLFHALQKQGIEIQNPHKGIYRISDVLSFGVQFIVTRELKSENHIWLKSLSDGLKAEDICRLLERMKQTEKHDREMADSVLDVCIRANTQLIDLLKGDEDMSEALLELMQPILIERDKKRDQKNKQIWIDQGISQGIQQGINQGINQGKIIAYYEMKQSTEQIAEKLNIKKSEVEKVIRDMNHQKKSEQ